MKVITLEVSKLTLKISLLLSIWTISILTLWAIAKSAVAMMV